MLSWLQTYASIIIEMAIGDAKTFRSLAFLVRRKS